MRERRIPQGTPTMIDAHQVAAWSGLSTASIYKFSNDGRFLKPSLHIGRNVRWDKNELERWKAAGFPPMPKWETPMSPWDAPRAETC